MPVNRFMHPNSRPAKCRGTEEEPDFSLKVEDSLEKSWVYSEDRDPIGDS